MQTNLKNIYSKTVQNLSGKWAPAVLACILPTALAQISGIFSAGNCFYGILAFPLTIGVIHFFMILQSAQTKQDAQAYRIIFLPFADYSRIMITFLKVLLWVSLGYLLCVIPGMIASLRYSQTFYIIAEDQNITPDEAMQKSIDMMYGHKWRLFGYECLIALAVILTAIFTLCIGLIWLMPFINMFKLNFYQSVKADYEANVKCNVNSDEFNK